MSDIALECKPDEALAKLLGFTKKQIYHQPNKGQVIKYLERNPEAIGIVDEDPGAAWPDYFKKYERTLDEKHGVEVYTKANTRLVVIKPRLEEWVLKQASASNINPSNFTLPNSGHELHKIINTRIPKFEQMITAMIDSKNPGLVYLKELLQGK